MDERRQFPRFPVTAPVTCFRYGRQRTMRSLDISRSGLKLEANFDLRVGESLDLTILVEGTTVRCKGKVLAMEELNHKVRARLCFAPPSDWEHGKLSNYLYRLSAGRKIAFPKWVTVEWVTVGLYILSAFLAYLLIRNYFFK